MTDSRRQRRVWYAVGAVLVVAFLAYGATAFKSNLTPYVSFDDASRMGSKVQVAGGLVENSTKYLDATEELRFDMVDEDGNFEEAIQIVAVGSYQEGVFHAEQLLVKCPSKYQGLEDDIKEYNSTT